MDSCLCKPPHPEFKLTESILYNHNHYASILLYYRIKFKNFELFPLELRIFVDASHQTGFELRLIYNITGMEIITMTKEFLFLNIGTTEFYIHQ